MDLLEQATKKNLKGTPPNFKRKTEQPEEVLKFDRDQVVVRSYVGGLVKSFERRAA